MTPVTIIWFVGAAIVGAVAGGLHLLRSAIGGSHTGVPLTVSAFALTVLAAAMLFHGVMLAARAQDAAAGPAPEARDDTDDTDDTTHTTHTDAMDDTAEVHDRGGSSEGPPAYTFRGGEVVVERAGRPARRHRSSRA